MNRTRAFLGVAITSLSTLMLELTLTRLFSATMYYHFAFMAISIALFGSGASGVFIYIARRKTVCRAHLDLACLPKWLWLASVLYALSAVSALCVVLNNPLSLDPGMGNYYRLAIIYVASALPFFFAGCVIAIAVTSFAEEISRLYLFDLAGAAAGCLMLIPVLNLIGAINTVLLVSVLASIAAGLFSLSGQAQRARFVGSLLLTAGLIGFAAYNIKTNRLDIRKTKGIEERDVLFSKWNSFSRITVVGDLSGDQVEIKIDADASTHIPRDAGNTELNRLQRHQISGLVYQLKRDANVLIIGPGGGGDVMIARAFGQRQIIAVEVNPIIAIDVMSSEPFKSFSGSIYQQPNVRLIIDEGRSFIRSSRERYDIIQATMVDTWAATVAGAFALTENNLYTVEAFKDYATHLTDDGMLTMTRWYFEPPDQLLRLISLTRAMMSELGISNPDKHIILVRDVRTDDERMPATFIFKKSEFTEVEVRAVEELVAQAGFELLYTPLTRPANVFTQMIEAADPAKVWDSFETNVEPTRDNSPFFFNSIRLSNLGRALSGAGEWQKTNLGTFVLFALLAIAAMLVAVFILGPLAMVGGDALEIDTRTRLSQLLYFACIGAGFIIVEVAMIQKFILFLGHPVYSLAIVLLSLLAFSGIGSFLSGRFDKDRLAVVLVKVLAALVVLVLIYVIALSPIFYGLVHLSRLVRIVISVALMMPLAVVMGMPMPLGIKVLNRRAPEMVPWAWGVNGAASVMGSIAALAIAILTGFNQALLVGAALYLLAAVFMISTGTAELESTADEERIEETVGAVSSHGQ
jgi:predicted membrane-bound spermidine synthase